MLRGGSGIAFNLPPAKGPNLSPPSADGATLSDSAHEVVSEDGFSRLASHRRPPTPLPFSPLFSLFLFRPLGEGGTNRFHGSSHFPPLPRPKGRTERSAPASARDRATAQLFSVGDGVQLKRHCTVGCTCSRISICLLVHKAENGLLLPIGSAMSREFVSEGRKEGRGTIALLRDVRDIPPRPTAHARAR